MTSKLKCRAHLFGATMDESYKKPNSFIMMNCVFLKENVWIKKREVLEKRTVWRSPSDSQKRYSRAPNFIQWNAGKFMDYIRHSCELIEPILDGRIERPPKFVVTMRDRVDGDLVSIIPELLNMSVVDLERMKFVIFESSLNLNTAHCQKSVLFRS